MAQMQEEEWQNGMCSHVCGGDCGTCWAAWCCNCFLYGRVDQRLEKFPNNNKEDLNLFNAGCCIMFLADYVHCLCIPLWLKRQEFRRRFNIRGNGCTDCLASYFCHPCTLSQLNTELKARAEQAQIGAKGAPMGYVQPQTQGMVYQPPQ